MSNPVFGLLGVVLPIVAVRRWRGIWRVAAALPLLAMGGMVLVIMIGVAFDPTSHNLWPLSLLLVALVGLGWLALLALLRRFLLPRPDTAGGR